MTYNLKCTNPDCSQGEFIIEKSISEPLITECPKCGSKLKQVFKPAAIIWNTQGNCGKINNK